jgi:glyoxylase-like metal-dependent hydrolase (beta-lactamase superfamily II)
MRIRFVIDTHIHADHRSAGRALAREAGAEYVLYAAAEVAFSTRAVRGGDRLPLGNVVADVIHTPGHTPERVCLLVGDRTRVDEPRFALTGHRLMTGDVGRTKLVGDPRGAALTLFASRQRSKALPDHVEVLPGAYAGSVCGWRLRGEPFSTIGFERRHNAAFKIDAANAFVEFMLADIPPPADTDELRAWNSGRGETRAQ